MKLRDIFEGKSFDVDRGIYLVYADDSVIYIGKNTMITNRIRHGHKNRNTPLWQAIQDNLPDSLNWNVKVQVVESEDPELLQYRTRAVEAELIRKHEPYLNTTYNPAAWTEQERVMNDKMIDPWEDAVAVYDENGDPVGDYIGIPHADADALLTALREVNDNITFDKMKPLVIGQMLEDEWDEETFVLLIQAAQELVRRTLAALPKHLRAGESMSDKTSELMDEIKRAAVGDGKYAGLPSHVYSLFGDALAKLDEVAALEAKLSNEIESRDGWKEAWKKSEAKLSKMERIATAADELMNAVDAFEGRIESVPFFSSAWEDLREALAGEKA